MKVESDAAISFFPEFEKLYSIIANEIVDLTDEQLDYISDNWEWAGWSIRNQISHMASLIPRWLVLRWGSTIFPLEDHGIANIEELTQSKSDRRLDDDIYWEINELSCLLNQLLTKFSPSILINPALHMNSILFSFNILFRFSSKCSLLSKSL